MPSKVYVLLKIPFSFESMFSLMPRNTNTVLIPHDIIYRQSPLAFGEGNVKGRIKNVLNYKKPSFWIVVVSIITVIIVGIALVTNPK